MLRDIADLTGVEAEIQAQLAAAVSDAERWLKGQAQVRRKLFSQLEEALAERDVLQVRQLLARVNATAGHDRTADENAIADVAASYLAEQQRVYAEQLQAEAAAKLAQQQDARERRAADRVQTLLATLERRGVDKPLKTMRKLVRELMHATSDAGDGVDAGQQEQIGVWKTRAEIGRPPAQTARPAPASAAPRPTRHEQVARRFWIKKNCPRCQAVAGKNCVVNAHTGTGTASKIPHYERIERILAERRTQNAGPRRSADGRHRGRMTLPARIAEDHRANAAPHQAAACIVRVSSAHGKPAVRSAAPRHPVRAQPAAGSSAPSCRPTTRTRSTRRPDSPSTEPRELHDSEYREVRGAGSLRPAW
nr:hypothetical protein OH820_35105 [Streptomyces sp. NBC_00857]